MRYSLLKRIYFNQDIKEGLVKIPSEYINYLYKVLRLKPSSRLRIFNKKQGEFLAEITLIDNKSCIARILENLRLPQERKTNLILAFALIKPDPLKLIFEKGTEIGVMEFIPLTCEFSQISKFNQEKMESIIMEAVKQSERLDIPKIHKISNLQSLVTEYQNAQIIFCNESEGKHNINNINLSSNQIIVLIGPEGGFSEKEVDFLKTFKNVSSVFLNSNVLRSETAAIAACSIIEAKRNYA